MNKVRGDVALPLDGVERRLRLTFGALAEIEAGLGVQDLAEMGARIGRLNARELRLVLGALLRGGGEDEAAAGLDAVCVNLPSAAEAVGQVFRVALE